MRFKKSYFLSIFLIVSAFIFVSIGCAETKTTQIIVEEMEKMGYKTQKLLPEEKNKIKGRTNEKSKSTPISQGGIEGTTIQNTIVLEHPRKKEPVLKQKPIPIAHLPNGETKTFLTRDEVIKEKTIENTMSKDNERVIIERPSQEYMEKVKQHIKSKLKNLGGLSQRETGTIFILPKD